MYTLTIIVFVVALIAYFYKRIYPEIHFAFKKATPEQKHAIRLLLYHLHDFEGNRKSIIQTYAQLFGFNVSYPPLSREKMISTLNTLTTIQKSFLAIIAFDIIQVNGTKAQEALYTHTFMKEIGVPVETLRYLENSLNTKLDEGVFC